ncbi:histidine phosphotransferase family protein [Octadecabacter temperatus]|uniref:histidine phosphotransferase family protein n=1 Tax=Octadecabacter temperatus TaxID=1458307 RepID=UPI001FD4145C|nr:histidine phosphotransferase family protein [Octadecabacter temperatus]
MSNFNALIGSRICHDLINPLGAIGNGIELLGLSGVADSPEMALVTESVQNAAAKVRFLRLAFGDATADQVVARSEILSILDEVSNGGRLSYSWNVPIDPPRLDVRVALLSAMCVETALPLGGDVQITHDDTNWTIQAKHDRLNLDPDLWAPLSKGENSHTLTAAQVHFGLLPQMAAEARRTLSFSHGSDWVAIQF